LATAIVVLSVAPPSLRPETGLPHDLEHLAIYSTVGFAFAVGYDLRRSVLVILLTIFSAGVEIAQLAVPGRHARLQDFIVDALAAGFGVMMASLVHRIRTRS